MRRPQSVDRDADVRVATPCPAGCQFAREDVKSYGGASDADDVLIKRRLNSRADDFLSARAGASMCCAAEDRSGVECWAAGDGSGVDQVTGVPVVAVRSA